MAVAYDYCDRSYIEYSPSSWLDDYFDWVAPHGCCRHYNDSSKFCPSNGNYLHLEYVSTETEVGRKTVIKLAQHVPLIC